MLYLILESMVEITVFAGKKVYQVASWLIYGHQETETEKLEKIIKDLEASISKLNSETSLLRSTLEIEMAQLKKK